MEPYIKGRKTLKNPSIRASVQPSSLKARETRNLIRGNRNGRVRRDNEVKERLGNNSPRVRAPNAVGCVSLKELKSLNSLSFLTFQSCRKLLRELFCWLAAEGRSGQFFHYTTPPAICQDFFLYFFAYKIFPKCFTTLKC